MVDFEWLAFEDVAAFVEVAREEVCDDDDLRVCEAEEEECARLVVFECEDVLEVVSVAFDAELVALEVCEAEECLVDEVADEVEAALVLLLAAEPEALAEPEGRT